MRIAWINPSFADYRVPVYSALDKASGDSLTVIFSRQRTSATVCEKLQSAIGDHAVPLDGEFSLDLGFNHADDFANVGLHLPYQPGLLRAIEQANPDVVVSEGFFQWTPASVFFKLTRRVPLVIAYERTAHTERAASGARLGYRKLIAKSANAFACNGILSKDFCINRFGISADRIVTGAMAADSDALAAACVAVSKEDRSALKSSLNLKAPIFLYVGKLVRRKGIHELLAAWSLHARSHTNPGTLLLVGDGPERHVANNHANVVLAGAIQYDQIPRYYAIADALVMPTLEDNWSLVVPEAMACSLPILCSIYNGCWPELVHTHRNGWTFNPAAPTELASLFNRCADHPELLPEMGQASKRIAANFTPQNAAQAVLRACQIALNN